MAKPNNSGPQWWHGAPGSSQANQPMAAPQSSGAPAGSGPGLTNTAAPDPNVTSWMNTAQGAYNKAANAGPDPLLQESIGNLRGRMSADTTGRAIDRAQSKNADVVAGQRRALTGRLSRSGLGGQAGIENKLQMRLDDRLQRANAGTAADITMGRERDLDNLAISGHGILAAPGQYALQQGAQANNLLGIGLGAANSLAGIAQGQQQLGINQFNSLSQAQMARAQFEAAERARREGQLMALGGL